jgi:hypothetical protein
MLIMNVISRRYRRIKKFQKRSKRYLRAHKHCYMTIFFINIIIKPYIALGSIIYWVGMAYDFDKYIGNFILIIILFFATLIMDFFLDP